ncbi:nucleotidyltransferase family protein [Sphingobium vermicomposti]|uniref:Uncharacterized protein n=1 Tax=Sphingobium vermicomposti TaxID=529005 RepID=A0A846MH37_9SPHN|nr:nucleotidyltransferase family protein [Sphingobium vermicomposti]NIJ16646.1 hypothetical protein [Sphingobium vermicomposti]
MNRLDRLQGLLACLDGDLPQQDDWPGIIELANHSLCTPMVASQLEAAGRFPALPPDLQRFLREVHVRNGERNRRLLLQLDEAATIMNAVGVEPILLKGTGWLAAAKEEQRADRLLTDLDLMVPPEGFHDVVDALVRAGYRPETAAVRPDVPLVLLRPEDAGTIDLHSEYGGATTLRFRHADLTVGGTRCRLPGSVAHLPPPVGSMAILLLHDQLKGRDYLRGRIDLRHMLDMRSLAAGFGPAEWESLDRLFPPGYARGAARTQLLTAHKLLGLSVPDAMIRDIRAQLQYWRRMIQVRWPVSALMLTMLSLCDPQYLAARRRWRLAKGGGASSSRATGRAWLPRRGSVARLLSWREVGKI